MIEKIIETALKWLKSVSYSKDVEHKEHIIVDLEDAQEILKETIQEVAKEYGNASDNDLTVVSALPSLYPLQPFEEEAIHKVVASAKDGGWIPVESELPKEHGKYIVTVENLTGRDILPEKVFECAYMYGQFIFNGSFDNRVTAWRNLPAPYQKGE